MFQKSGVISGGAYDLQRKAQKWEEKEFDQLRATRAMKKRKESQLQSIVKAINGLHQRTRV